MSAYTKDPGGSLIQFSKSHPTAPAVPAAPSAPIARAGESPVPHEPQASEHEFDMALAQLEGPIRMMRNLREKISVLERRREELETIVIRERTTFRDQLGRAKKVISETGGALAKTKEDAQRIHHASEEARKQLQHSGQRLEAAVAEINRLRYQLDGANRRMTQTATEFQTRYTQDTGKLQQTIEQVKSRYAVELATFKQACTDLRMRAMTAENAFKQVQTREGDLRTQASAVLNKLKSREQQLKKMALSSHLWASELERLRRENDELNSRAATIPTIEKEREHWRGVAEGEREQRRAILDNERLKREKLEATEQQLWAKLAETERELTGKLERTKNELQAKVTEIERHAEERITTRELELQGKMLEVESELKTKHAEEIARLQTELKLVREQLDGTREREEAVRGGQEKAQSELLQAMTTLERAKIGEAQAKNELSRTRAQLEISGEQVRRLRFEGPLRELLTAKERELGRILDASQSLPADDPSRIRVDRVIDVLSRQVETLRSALSGKIQAVEPPWVAQPRKAVTPPPFPAEKLAAQELKPPSIISDPISE